LRGRLLAVLLILSANAFAATEGDAGVFEIQGLRVHGAPRWVSVGRLEKVTRRVERVLEWDIRKTQVHFYSSADAFEKVHGLGSRAVAVTLKGKQEIHVGPRVSTGDFDAVFAHELVHLILGQKYRQAVPAWLEEGLANQVARRGKPDYRWLVTELERRPRGSWNVENLTHPFQNSSAIDGSDSVRFHYEASTALAELIASRCNWSDLLQLSVGSRLERYLKTFCGMPEMTESFRSWVGKKARGR
jgi:hypothetical protein